MAVLAEQECLAQKKAILEVRERELQSAYETR